MARWLLLLVAGILVAASQAGSEFLAEENPIRQVIDGLHELDSSIIRIVGDSRRALSFSRFARRSAAVSALFCDFWLMMRLEFLPYLLWCVDESSLSKGTGRVTTALRRFKVGSRSFRKPWKWSDRITRRGCLTLWELMVYIIYEINLFFNSIDEYSSA